MNLITKQEVTASKNLFPKIHAFPNLLLAAANTRDGQRFEPPAARFDLHLAQNLLRLQREIREKTWQPGAFKTFLIEEPKRRMISAAPYRDRVLHHALCNITAPLFERTFIHDSYANRLGKGSHAAVRRYQQFARQFPLVLKCDVRKFFPSLDHQILKQTLHRKIACPDTRWLMDTIIDGSNPQEEHLVHFPGDDLFTPLERRRGLPIGNLTSQWWGNISLNSFDHFVKETLRVRGYIRYVDDFVLFGHSRAELLGHLAAVEAFLASLRLILHPTKTQIHRVADGVPFLGFRVWPHHRVVKKASRNRYRRHLRKKLAERRAGKFPPSRLENGLNSWLGHVRFGKCARMEADLFRKLVAEGVNLFRHPNGSWRVLEVEPRPKN